MHRKPLLIALAGETDLRLLSQEAPGHMPRDVRHLTAADYPDVDKEFDAPPGRGHGAGGAGRHGFETANEQAVERARFADHAAEALADAWAGGGYRGIILAAGPKMLGALRQRLDEATAIHVLRQMPKDLVGVPLADLDSHLAPQGPGGV